MRSINQRFINDLCSGELTYFLKQVHEKRCLLSLEIRKGYVNIYYRGGNLLKITQKRRGYSFHFDSRYCLNKGDDKSYNLLNSLDSNSADDYKAYFPLMMKEMDSWFEVHPKKEREFQHNLLHYNSTIIDIEYQLNYKDDDNKLKSMRLDMIVVEDGKMIIVENKYGESAVSGKAGIAKHYEDICKVLNDKTLHLELVQSIINISNAKKQLGLSNNSIALKNLQNTEILFLLANYNAKSCRIQNEVKSMTHTFPAKLLMLNKDEYCINYLKAEDLFGYGY